MHVLGLVLPHFYIPLATDMINVDEFCKKDDPYNEQGFKAFKFDQGEAFPSLAHARPEYLVELFGRP
jgi:hypothetical protein